MLKITLLIFFLLNVFNWGCNSSNKSTKNISSNQYFPIAEGNSWTYINEAPTEETELFKVKVNKVETKNNSIEVELSSFPFFSKEEKTTRLVINLDKSIGTINSENTSETFLPKNSDITASYTFTYGKWTGYISNLSDTVKTEKGSYSNCLLIGYAMGGITYAASIWYVKDIGIVKWGYFRTNPPTLHPQYYVLKDYKLN